MEGLKVLFEKHPEQFEDFIMELCHDKCPSEYGLKDATRDKCIGAWSCWCEDCWMNAVTANLNGNSDLKIVDGNL
jgi:hypothetical protein